MKYICDDGNAEVEIEAKTSKEAAEIYVEGGDWGETSSTIWINVWVFPLDEDGNKIEDESKNITICVDPEEPECSNLDHNWESPYEVLGGLKENPGVYGNGGGVIIATVCSHCGKYKITDSWAQNPENGEQGLDSVEYREADEKSLNWIENNDL